MGKIDNINDQPTEAQEIRMLHNISTLLLERKDLTENTKTLIFQIFGS